MSKKIPAWTDENVIAWCVARGVQSAPIKQCVNCLHFFEAANSRPCNSCMYRESLTDNFIMAKDES
jgi:hypothetical protein